METKNDLFVSYSAKDYDKVTEIVNKMTSLGAKCWFQTNDSKQTFAEAIIDGIETSNSFVVFLSENSIKSIYVLNEIECAIDKLSEDDNYKILPVIIGSLDFKSPEFKKIKIFLGSFNMLMESDYPSVDNLVLKIFDQIDFRAHDNETNKDSIYSGASEVEQQRIFAQNALFNRYANVYLDEVFANIQNANVLDIGCSDGNNILLRLKKRDYATLLGIDIDTNKITIANERHKNDKNTFLQANITEDNALTILDNYLKEKNISGFDLIHISAVLLHLKDAGTLLQKLHDYLSPNGYIFIQDEDDNLNHVYPRYQFFDDCFYIWEHSLESGDRSCGLKIASYLKNANYSHIDLKKTTISSLDFNGEFKETLWDLYFNPNLWDANDESYFDDLQSVQLLPNYFKEHDHYKQLYMQGEITIVMGVFFYIAQK